MNAIPKRLLPHQVTYKLLLGSSAYEDEYGDPVTVPGRIQYQRRLVRNAQGAEVMSACTIYFRPAEAPTLGSVIVLPEGERVVIVRSDITGSRHGHHVVIDVG